MVLRMSAAHVIVADVDGPVDEEDLHHLGRVLRLRAGEVVTLADGAGGWRTARWTGDRIEADGPVQHAPAPAVKVTVGFAPVKGDRPEWTVQKLTELGVDHIVVLRAARSVVRWDGGRGAAQLERLRRVARAAAGQSRRCYLPLIEACDGIPDGALAHFGGEPIAAAGTPVMIGPEGGWTDEEVAGRVLVSLGPTVLRAETAAVAAGVLLTAARERA